MSLAASAFPRPQLRQEAGALWRLSWPMLIGQLATVGMGVADVAMTGHTSADELAAVSLGASIWSIILVTVSGTMMAINSIVAHDVGAGELAKVPHTVRQSLWKSLGVGIIAMLLANLATLLFDHLYLTPHVQHQAELFVHIISLGLPPFAAYRALYGYSTSINQTRPVMLIAIIGLGVNVFVNWLLVFGNWGLPQLGGVGCAVATALCFALADPIARVLGKTGINVMTRLMGLILAALAVEVMADGLGKLFPVLVAR